MLDEMFGLTIILIKVLQQNGHSVKFTEKMLSCLKGPDEALYLIELCTNNPGISEKELLQARRTYVGER